MVHGGRNSSELHLPRRLQTKYLNGQTQGQTIVDSSHSDEFSLRSVSLQTMEGLMTPSGFSDFVIELAELLALDPVTVIFGAPMLHRYITSIIISSVCLLTHHFLTPRRRLDQLTMQT